MAWNAVLAAGPDERYGRSYMEHVVALAETTGDARSRRGPAAARLLRETPAGAAPAGSSHRAGPTLAPLEAARTIDRPGRRAHRYVSENG